MESGRPRHRVRPTFTRESWFPKEKKKKIKFHRLYIYLSMDSCKNAAVYDYQLYQDNTRFLPPTHTPILYIRERFVG